jgi:ribosomal protein S18 acetylase RimI-like enzyme
MALNCIHDRAVLAAFLEQAPALHAYALGDLDDFFWPHTTWYGWVEERALRAVALVYTAVELPVLLALGAPPLTPLSALLMAARRLLPPRFYTHLTPGLEPCLGEHFELTPHGRHVKMALPGAPRASDDASIERLGPEQLPEVATFYAASYPGNWFDARMLATGCYFGRRVAGVLACVAGVHVYSPAYRVAALGNIATHPARRGHGDAQATTAAVCRHLRREGIATITLNVHAENAAALACYRRLGFVDVAAYEEYLATQRSGGAAPPAGHTPPGGVVRD